MREVKLLLPTEYIMRAAAAAREAKDSIYILSMVIADHPETHPLIVELKNAAERGVKVVVAADIFTYGEVSGGFFPLRYFNHGARHTNRMVRELKRAGVHFHWLGSARITVFHGRTHNKWSVIDDTVFCFGGINLYDGGIQNVDYMFELQNAPLAKRLAEEQVRIQKAERSSRNFPSFIYELEGMDVLIDGGIIGQSVIYRRLMELSANASHITFVSQYCPTGRLARVLRKKDAELFFNQPKQAQGLNRIVIRLGQWVTGLKSIYTRPVYLHAKCIIFTAEDGTKTAISGSHNFAHTGVLLGTREIAIETQDTTIIAQLEAFINTEIRQ